MSLYPLKFKPRLVPKIWGGRKLESLLNKSLPPGEMIGESWELYDFPPGVAEPTERWMSSEIINGPLAGRTLHEVMESSGRDLLGDAKRLAPVNQFPILIKFLDAREDLSVQVHPDARYAQSHPGVHLKTEAWYVVEAQKDSRIYRGIRPGTNRQILRDAVNRGTVEEHLISVRCEAGQCHFLPSGTVHALGAGMLVAEVQTPSDTTFRLYDFGRIDPATGKPRALHVEEALACIEFSGEPLAEQPQSNAEMPTPATRLVSCPHFALTKVHFSKGAEAPLTNGQPAVWMMLAGRTRITVANLPEPISLGRGETILLPAKMERPTINTLSDCTWLEVTFP